jgi:hypothetical protein
MSPMRPDTVHAMDQALVIHPSNEKALMLVGDGGLCLMFQHGSIVCVVGSVDDHGGWGCARRIFWKVVGANGQGGEEEEVLAKLVGLLLVSGNPEIVLGDKVHHLCTEEVIIVLVGSFEHC